MADPLTGKKFDTTGVSSAALNALERLGFAPVATLGPPPVLCERCKAAVPFGGKRCRSCEWRWARWMEEGRARMREGLAAERNLERRVHDPAEEQGGQREDGEDRDQEREPA